MPEGTYAIQELEVLGLLPRSKTGSGWIIIGRTEGALPGSPRPAGAGGPPSASQEPGGRKPSSSAAAIGARAAAQAVGEFRRHSEGKRLEERSVARSRLGSEGRGLSWRSRNRGSIAPATPYRARRWSGCGGWCGTLRRRSGSPSSRRTERGAARVGGAV
jgi:hypothetical protein